jgi:hypothetical protein
MDEARRFLRYVLPGLVYGIETLLWLYIVLPDWTYSVILKTAEKDSLGVALWGVLASGAVGYVFATVHHWCHWHLPIDEPILNHTSLINQLDAAELHGRTVDRQEALVRSLARWYSADLREATYKKLDSLGDQAHALGTARIASFFSLATALPISAAIGTFSLTAGSIFRLALVLVLGIAAICLFHNAYRHVGIVAQGIYDRILREASSRRAAA